MKILGWRFWLRSTNKSQTFATDGALKAHLETLREASKDRISYGDWFSNQGERSRLLICRGYVFARIDRITA